MENALMLELPGSTLTLVTEYAIPKGASSRFAFAISATVFTIPMVVIRPPPLLTQSLTALTSLERIVRWVPG